MLSVDSTILLCGFPHKNPHKFHNHDCRDLCVMEICVRLQRPERVVLLIKTISMAIKKSNKAEVGDNQPLSGNTWSLMIKTRKWWFANFEGCTSQILRSCPELSKETQGPDDFGQKNCSNNWKWKSVEADENQ
jgi:hypothetical protein